MYLERQPRLHLLSQHLCDTAIEVRQDLHRELGLDAALADQVIEGVRKRHADAKGLCQYRIAKWLVEQGTVPATAIELVKGLSSRRHDGCAGWERRCRVEVLLCRDFGYT